MPHYHLQGFANDWTLVRETPSSQKYRVKTPDGHEMAVDIHFTPSKILTVSIMFQGKDGKESSKGILTPVMDEIARIGLYRGDYGLIDYTLAETDLISDGNYSVDDKDRKHRQL